MNSEHYIISISEEGMALDAIEEELSLLYIESNNLSEYQEKLISSYRFNMRKLSNQQEIILYKIDALNALATKILNKAD